MQDSGEYDMNGSIIKNPINFKYLVMFKKRTRCDCHLGNLKTDGKV